MDQKRNCDEKWEKERKYRETYLILVIIGIS